MDLMVDDGGLVGPDADLIVVVRNGGLDDGTWWTMVDFGLDGGLNGGLGGRNGGLDGGS